MDEMKHKLISIAQCTKIKGKENKIEGKGKIEKVDNTH